MCFVDNEPAHVYSAQWVRARKPHRCDECDRTIEVGERYERATALWDSWSSWALCRDCDSLRTAIEDHERAEGCIGVEVVAFIRERGFPPTLREIGKGLDIRSTNGVSDHLKNLEKNGLIQVDDIVSRGIRVLVNIPPAATGTEGAP
jgi:predicted MarR family transcription regulator